MDAHAEALGVRGERLSQLLVATEPATNAMRLGGGAGTLHPVWRPTARVFRQVIDGAPGIGEPHPTARAGRS